MNKEPARPAKAPDGGDWPTEGPRAYEADKNPEFIPDGDRKNADGSPAMRPNPDYKAWMGVPNRDIPEDEFAAFPLHVQRAIDASPFHRKTKPAAPKPAAAKPEPTS